jgi:diadenosine tetraphosphatase ApaH/serine/threonine PP2A family protein phosphatase
MRVAVVSDIHANLPALEAVLAAVDEEAPDEVWCLGDVVGYGPHPNECCAVVRERAGLCLAGNHDLAVIGTISIDAFSGDAAAAARWTQTVLTDYSRAYLESLEPQAEVEGAELYHASPRDPIWEYVLSTLLAELCLDVQDQRVCLIGHSHVALSFHRPEGAPTTGEARRGGELASLDSGEWLINPGSVGQPRDGDPRAAWLLLDTATQAATWNRTEYDVDGAASAIRAARLPDSLAERLEYGQ